MLSSGIADRSEGKAAGPRTDASPTGSGRFQGEMTAKPSLLGRHSLVQLSNQSQRRIDLVRVQNR